MPHVESHTPGAAAWVDLATDDPEAARGFYGTLFGWTFEIGGPELGGYALAQLDGRNVGGLGPKPPGMPMPTAWTLYFASADAKATAAAIKEAGGTVIVEPMDVMGEGWMAIASEPTGAVFGLWQPGRNKGARTIGEPGSLAWNELNTRDGKKAAAFLAKVFGHEVKKLDAPGMDYQTLHLGDQTVGGVLQMNAQWPAEVPAHWMIYFAVDDTDARSTQVTSLGGKVCVPPFDSPYGRIAVVEDPQGAVFSLVQTTPPA
jgi:uncharacterized protein